MMKRIGIIVAMQKEYALVETLLEHTEKLDVSGMPFLRGEVDGVEVLLAQGGIGKVNAAVCAVEMIRGYSPNAIVNTGVAGGIDTGIRVMDIVVGKEMVYHDVWCGEGNVYGQVQGLPERFVSDPGLVELATKIDADLPLTTGLICSGDQFITDHKALQGIKERFPDGIAVDMESCAIAQVCYLYRIPFLSYRIISDIPGDVQEQAKQYRNFWEDAPHRSFAMLRNLIKALK